MNFFSRFLEWMPLLLLSAVGVVIPLLFGVWYLHVLLTYLGIVAFLVVVCLINGRIFNYGFLPAYVKTHKRLDGYTAIVTGANRYEIYIHFVMNE